MTIRLRTFSRLLIGAVIVVFVAVAALAATQPHAAAVPAWEDPGASLNAAPAPNFALRDQNGRLVSLRGQRGHAVLLTFFYTHCPDTCPLTAQKLKTVLRGFGAEAAKVSILIVTTDPLRDNRADAKAFLRKNGLASWHFLLGGYDRLRSVWSSYHIYVPSPGVRRATGPAHSAVMYLIDGAGREQVLLDDSITAAALAQNLHILLRDRHWLSRLPVAPAVGARAPGFDLASPRSGRIDLRHFRGRPLLLNFWATWCIPCRTEMPLLERIYRRHAPRLRIVGIDEQEPANEVLAYVRQVHVTYPIALDSQGNAMYGFQVAGTPTTFFIDSTGVIRSIKVGPLTTGEAEAQVRTLLGR